MMNKFNFSIFMVFMVGTALPAFANDVMVASAMQRCTTNQECQLVSNSCNDNCAFVPINTGNLAAVQSMYQSRCGKAMTANPQCTTNPPMAPACINARCTIDYPYANHAGPKDYQSGAYPVPQKAEPSKVQGDYTGVNDKTGKFSAYNLPQGAVKQDTMGQLTTTIYVPPSAPVSGANYIPVVPPAAVPAPRANATPPVVTQGAPVYPAQQPVQQQPQPAPVAAPQSGQVYVPAPTQPTVPAPGLPPAPQAQTPRSPGPAPVAAVGAPGVPQAPPGATPIPPSDLKPAPTFVPPPGTAVKVAPDDPGAPPPAGTLVSMPTEDGGVVTVGDTKAKAAQKSFGKTMKESEYN